MSLQWDRSRKLGHGVLRYRTGQVYDGDWLYDIRTGFGTFTESDKFTYYTGDFVDNVRCGQGEQRFPDGTVYFG